MPRGVTEISRKIYDLHMTIFWVCVAIGVVVFGVMIWSLIAYRKSRGAVADVTLVHNTKVEFIWTIVPVFILIAMAVPAARTLVEIEDTTKTELTIKVTGFQWGWQYDYLDDGVAYYSHLDRKSNAARELLSGIDPNTVDHYLLNVDNPLVVPVATKVRLLITGCRRHPLLVGAGLRRQERCDSRLRERGLVPRRRRQARALPRAVRRAVRARSRLHADRGRRALQGGLRRVAEGQGRRAEAGRPRPATAPATPAHPAAPAAAAATSAVGLTDSALTARHHAKRESSTWPSPRTRRRRTTITITSRTAGGAGSTRPITKTSARCT